jgi:hypothetical protein
MRNLCLGRNLRPYIDINFWALYIGIHLTLSEPKVAMGDSLKWKSLVEATRIKLEEVIGNSSIDDHNKKKLEEECTLKSAKNDKSHNKFLRQTQTLNPYVWRNPEP